jgi:membrane-bound metal-dependent hydrolase YbcI (DUF457 family)
MLVGHFAVGLAAKRVEPTISLGALVLAAMLADLLWCIFMIAGIEQVQFRPGTGAANYYAASNIAMSHSLLMDALWAGLLAAGYFLRQRYPRGAWILFGAVVSHWLLDWISHRPDMPLAPGTHRHFGLGLWTSIPATVIVEGGFWLLAVIFYARATHAKKRAGVYAYWSVIVILTLAWYNNIAGPPPPDPRAAPIVSFAFFSLTVAWAYWMNRLRSTAAAPP